MSARFITMALLIIAAMTLTACTTGSGNAQGTPFAVGTIVAKYTVHGATVTEFIPAGDQNTLCVAWFYGVSCVKKEGK